MSPNKRASKRSKRTAFDITPFKNDIDDLIGEFAKDESTELVDMKRVWSSKKFSFIFEARPSTNLARFMQSLYAHAIGYVVSAASLSRRLGGLYCLYCLHETQPFKPPFRISLSLGELKRLKNLVVESKKVNVKVASVLFKGMFERNMFLFGAVDLNESSMNKRVDELKGIENAYVRVAQKKLFANRRIEHFIHMDLGMELDVDHLKKMSTVYAAAKELAIKGADGVVDVQNVKHLAVSNQSLVGDAVDKTAEEWNNQKHLFYQQTGFGQCSTEKLNEHGEDSNFGQQGNKTIELGREHYGNHEEEEDEDLILELERELSPE